MGRSKGPAKGDDTQTWGWEGVGEGRGRTRASEEGHRTAARATSYCWQDHGKGARTTLASLISSHIPVAVGLLLAVSGGQGTMDNVLHSGHLPGHHTRQRDQWKGIE